MSVRRWLIAAAVFAAAVHAGSADRPASAQSAAPPFGTANCIDRGQIVRDIAETKILISEIKKKRNRIDETKKELFSAVELANNKYEKVENDLYKTEVYMKDVFLEYHSIYKTLTDKQKGEIREKYSTYNDEIYWTGIQLSINHSLSASIVPKLMNVSDRIGKTYQKFVLLSERSEKLSIDFHVAENKSRLFVSKNTSILLEIEYQLNKLSQRLIKLESSLANAGVPPCGVGSPFVATLPKAGDGVLRKPEASTSGEIDLGPVEVWEGDGDIKPGRVIVPDEYLKPPRAGGGLRVKELEKAADGSRAPKGSKGTGALVFPSEYLETGPRRSAGASNGRNPAPRTANDADGSAPDKLTGPTSAVGDPLLPPESLAPPGDGAITNLAALSPTTPLAPKIAAGGGNDFFRYIPNPDRWTDLMDATPRASPCDYDLTRLCQKLGPQYANDCEAALTPWQTACRNSYPRRGWVTRSACERECQVDALDARADLDIRPMILAVIDSAGGTSPKIFKLSEDLNAARIDLQDLEETIRNRRIYIYTNSDTGAIIQHDGPYFDPTPPLVFTGEMKASELPAHTAKRREITRRIDRLDRLLKAEKASSVDMSDWKSWARRFWLGNGADRHSRYQCEEPDIKAGLASCIAYCNSQLSRSSSEPDYVSNDFCGHEHAFQWLHHPVSRMWLYPPGHPSRNPARNELVGFSPMTIPKMPANPFAGMSKEQIRKSILNSASPAPRPVMPTAPVSPALR